MEILLLNLKIAGLTLLLSVTGCTTELCNQARDVANMAINFVPATTTQAVITEPVITQAITPIPTPTQSPTPTPTQPVLQQQSFGSIITPTITQQTMEIVLKDENNTVYGDSVGIQSGDAVKLFINVDYLLNGVSQKSDIVMTSSDGQTKTILGADRGWNQRGAGGPRDDGSANFQYRVTTPGTHTVTFTVGESSKTLTVNAI